MRGGVVVLLIVLAFRFASGPDASGRHEEPVAESSAEGSSGAPSRTSQLPPQREGRAEGFEAPQPRAAERGERAGGSARTARKYQTITFGDETPLYAGQAFEAFVEVGGRYLRMMPNQAGNFPRVFVDKPEPVSIRVKMPDASVGDRVVVNVLDGGELVDGEARERYTVRLVEEDRCVAVTLEPSANSGSHRVLFRHFGQTCVADVWVGPDNEYRSLSSR